MAAEALDAGVSVRAPAAADRDYLPHGDPDTKRGPRGTSSRFRGVTRHRCARAGAAGASRACAGRRGPYADPVTARGARAGARSAGRRTSGTPRSRSIWAGTTTRTTPVRRPCHAAVPPHQRRACRAPSVSTTARVSRHRRGAAGGAAWQCSGLLPCTCLRCTPRATAADRAPSLKAAAVWAPACVTQPLCSSRQHRLLATKGRPLGCPAAGLLGLALCRAERARAMQARRTT
jgi:hypothetical protein